MLPDLSQALRHTLLCLSQDCSLVLREAKYRRTNKDTPTFRSVSTRSVLSKCHIPVSAMERCGVQRSAKELMENSKVLSTFTINIHT
jgi:hypothetical protein